MAKLHFYFSTMNAGKSTHLLQANFNYLSDGHKTFLIKPAIDDRSGISTISSRIGISAEAFPITKEISIYELIKEEHKKEHLTAILVDEVQFFDREQILDLCKVVDNLNIAVLAYGLKTNFKGELFEGSKALLELANNLNEIKTLCHCGSKATMVLKYHPDGTICRSGEEIEIGAEERYVATCRKHFIEGDIGNTARSYLKSNPIINRQRYASIISRTLKMSFKDAYEFSSEKLEDLLVSVQNEIEITNKLLLEPSVNSYRKSILTNSLSSLKRLFHELNSFHDS